MSDPAPASSSRTSSLDELKKGITGEAGVPQNVSLADAPTERPPDFPQWPTMSNPLPDSFIAWVTAKRNAIDVSKYKFGDQTRLINKVKTLSGHSYAGKPLRPTTVVEPADLAGLGESDQAKMAALVERLHEEMKSEGGVSAQMTGDPARFTWGRGLTGVPLAEAFTEFLDKAPGAKDAFLDCGVTMIGGQWRIIDTHTGGWKTGNEALDILDGYEPKDEKRRMLAVFAKITEDNLQAAADAQWPRFKDRFLRKAPFKPPQDVLRTWTPEAIAYVIHLGAWGANWKGWGEFAKTGGDRAKILRFETDALPASYFTADQPYVRVKAEGGGAFPSNTMIFALGLGMMWKDGIVKPIGGLGEAGKGDVVFEVPKPHKDKVGGADFVILRGVPRMFTPKDPEKEEFAKWVADNHYKDMEHLLKACEARGYQKLLKTRNWFAALDENGVAPQEQKYGLRPRVAMDAILHKGDPGSAGWILSDADRAGINENQCWDQYALLKAKLNVA